MNRSDTGSSDAGAVTRVDSWLWAIRLTKTRSQATAACKGGHVKVNAKTAKPSTPLKVGDRVQAFLNQTQREVEVLRLIDKRVGAPVAVTCYVDHTPAPPAAEQSSVTGARDRGAGRPTKRERRQLDRFRGRG